VNSEVLQLCIAILSWWDMVKDQHVIMPDFVQMAMRILVEAVENVPKEDKYEEDKSET